MKPYPILFPLHEVGLTLREFFRTQVETHGTEFGLTATALSIRKAICIDLINDIHDPFSLSVDYLVYLSTLNSKSERLTKRMVRSIASELWYAKAVEIVVKEMEEK